MRAPRVLILATPYLYATALAVCFDLGGRCEVVIPDVIAGESVVDRGYDVVVVAGPPDQFPFAVIPTGNVTITLPARAWDEPLVVRAGGCTQRIMVDPASGLDQVAPVVRRFVDLTAL